MIAFLSNVMLALLWVVSTGVMTVSNALLGFAIMYFVLWWLQPVFGPTVYFQKLPLALRFGAFYLWEVLLSNLRVAWDVVTPRTYRRPGIIAIPLDAQTDWEIALLANLLTLTPGTLSIDVSDDRQTLYVHVMFVDDRERIIRDIKTRFEQPVLALLRSRPDRGAK
jgi:multicomponent Na+:H+ antiporter subunit E